MVKYIAHNGMKETEIEADAVSVVTDDGTKVELQFRKSDGVISLSVNGNLLITPMASNVVRIARISDEAERRGEPMTKAQLLAVGSTAGLESGGSSAAVCLTDEQRRQIRQAAKDAYDKLRWYLGDSRELKEELQLLARDSFLEGMRQERSNLT